MERTMKQKLLDALRSAGAPALNPAAPKKAADKAADKKDAPKKDAPKKDAPKKDAPKKDAPKKDAPKKDAPKKDAPKKDAPKKDATPEQKTLTRQEIAGFVRGLALPVWLEISATEVAADEAMPGLIDQFLKWYADYSAANFKAAVFTRGKNNRGENRVYATPFATQKVKNGESAPVKAAISAAALMRWQGLDCGAAFTAVCTQYGVQKFTCHQVIAGNCVGAAGLVQTLVRLEIQLANAAELAKPEKFELLRDAAFKRYARLVDVTYCEGGDAGRKILEYAWRARKHIIPGK